MEQAWDPEQEGVRLGAELLEELAEIPGVSGANLTAVGNVEAIPGKFAGREFPDKN